MKLSSSGFCSPVNPMPAVIDLMALRTVDREFMVAAYLSQLWSVRMYSAHSYDSASAISSRLTRPRASSSRSQWYQSSQCSSPWRIASRCAPRPRARGRAADYRGVGWGIEDVRYRTAADAARAAP